MNPEDRRRNIQRNNRRKENLRKAYFIAVGVVALLLVIFCALNAREAAKEKAAGRDASPVQTASADNTGRGDLVITPTPTPDPTPEPTPEPAQFVYTVRPEAEDGTGKAGRGRYDDEPAAAEEGFVITYTGTKYYFPDGTYLVNGWLEQGGAWLHFSADGYMAKGWTAVAGKGYFFDDRGAWVPDEDGTKLVALTFDDGPGEFTDRILNVLSAYNAKATFFLIGVEIEKYGDQVLPRMAAEGHLIGNHSYSHVQMPADENADEAEWQFYLCDELIRKYTGGEIAKVVRFPFGDYSHYGVRRVNRPNILWDLDTYDWEDGANTASIMAEVQSLLEPGNIFLMHDIYETTAEACETLIPWLYEQGYKCVTIKELAASRGYELENGVTYLSFKQLNIDEGRVTDE